MVDLSAAMIGLGARPLERVLGTEVSRQAAGAALRLLRQSAELAGAALPAEPRLDWLELANKLEAFEHFQQAPALIGLAPAADVPLPEQLRRAESFGAYRSIWTVEGLGYALAERAAAGTPRRLLADGAGVPAAAVVPLHTGAALAFAERLLAADSQPGAAALERWLALWEADARPGYRDVAADALGLVARNLYPWRLPQLDAALRALDPALADLLWHGAGRGLYFAPVHALPWSGAAERALDRAWDEPAGEAGRRNATAGLAWALTLVNVRHPEVLADLLRRRGREIRAPEAFAHGVASAVLVWRDFAGRDPHLEAFLAYRPDGAGAVLPALWRELVLAPCETALRETYPRLRQSGSFAALFRCA